MSRILVIAILVLWLLRSGNTLELERHGALPVEAGAVIYLAGMAALVLGVRWWSVRAARKSAQAGRRLQRVMPIVRNAIVVWLGIGIFGGLKWGLFVDACLGALKSYPSPEMMFELPPLALGTLPALAAWVGLWWAQYPAERAMREQNLLAQLNDNLPVHTPPSFRRIFGANLRLQVLFTLVPVLVIVGVHDLVVAGLAMAGHPRAGSAAEGAMLPVAAAIFVLAPELLRRIADSEPLAAGPLRTRLEGLARSAGMRYREILLWKTQNSMSNAFVMGIFGRVRYVLLSDELLATLRDDEVEAVFAHEMGHVVHHHLFWLAVVVMSVAGALAGPLDLAVRCVHVPENNHWLGGLLEVGQYGMALLMTLAALSWLSQRFERQADVFAARMLQRERETPLPANSRRALLESSWVGEYGAGVFNAALRRVADVNNIPLRARDWLHPSISKRIGYLQEMSAERSRTAGFDRVMRRTLALVLTALVVFGAWTVAQNVWFP